MSPKLQPALQPAWPAAGAVAMSRRHAPEKAFAVSLLTSSPSHPKDDYNWGLTPIMPATSHHQGEDGMTGTTKPRIASVDFTRGLAVAGMILANNPGDYVYIYRQFTHAHWHGWTVTDFIFPLFLFMVGVSAGLTVDKAKVNAGEVHDFWTKVYKRAALLFLFGLIENAFPHFHWETLRIPGVLQRIAVVYLAAVWLHLRLSNRGIVAVASGIVIGYWLLLSDMPVPGYGHPSITSEENLEGWLDHVMLRGHIWEYDTEWDPEGILSTFPAIAIAMAGILCGRRMRSGTGLSWTWIFFIGLALHLGGFAFDRYCPIIKMICTSSFVLFVSGSFIMLLTLSHAVIDVKGWTRLAMPCIILGMNSLTIYLGSEFFSRILLMIKFSDGHGGTTSLHYYIFLKLFGGIQNHDLASLLWSIGYLTLMWIPAYFLYRRKIFIKL
jgi:predicted acyltransferase